METIRSKGNLQNLIPIAVVASNFSASGDG